MNGKKSRNIRKSELRDVECLYISLLWDDMHPSNEEKAIIKADGVKEFKVKITKVDKIEGIIYGIAMKSDSVDTQGDWYSKETVRKTGRKYIDFLITEIGKNEPSDTNHNLIAAKGIKLIESSIDESDPKCTKWVIAVDIRENAEAMQKAKEGAITGWSIYGTAVKIEKSESIGETIKNALTDFFEGFNISKKDNITKGDLQMKEFKEAMSTEEGKTALKEFAVTDEGKALIAEAGLAIKGSEEASSKEGNTSKVEQLEADIEVEKGKITDLETAKVELETEKVELEKSNTTLETEKTALQEKVTELEKKNKKFHDLNPPKNPKDAKSETVDDILKDTKEKALDKATGKGKAVK